MTDPAEIVALERWADIRNKPKSVVACGERWEKVAVKIGCRLHGFNDGYGASFFTPDGDVIEVGEKFRAAIAAISPPDPTLLAEIERYKALFGEARAGLLRVQDCLNAESDYPAKTAYYIARDTLAKLPPS